MNRLGLSFALALLAMFPRTTLADWNDAQLIQAIYPQSDGDIWIQQPNYNGTGCNAANGKYFRLSRNHPNFKEIYALVLSAHLAERPVNLYLQTGVCATDNTSVVTLAILGTLVTN